MKIEDILKDENGTYVHCYKQGVFWVCYEQSAYAMFMEKGYKPTQKFVKKLGTDVVSIGFPQDAMDKWKKETQWKMVKDEPLQCSFLLPKAVSYEEFSNWKIGLPPSVEPCKSVVENQKERELTHIERRILNFPLGNKTPIETMMFLRELQEEMGSWVIRE